MAGIGSNFFDDEPSFRVATAPNRKGRRYSRRALAGVGVIAAAGFAVGVGSGLQAKAHAANKQPLLTYVAKQGDTLSSIVERITHKADVREDVFNLESKVKLNAEHPDHSTVQPGDEVTYQSDGHIVDYVERP